MATLLEGVNEVLKRVSIVDSNGELASLTSSGKQTYIDLAVQVLNEALEQMYTSANRPLPKELAEATITLVDGTRSYALASDVVTLNWPMLDETNGQFISEYPGGYLNLVNSQQFPANETGLPYWGALSPVNNEIYMDKIPQSTEAGRVYKYRYDKDISLSVAADTFPFSDAAFRALVPAAAELWRLYQQNKFVDGIFNASMGRASRIAFGQAPKKSWRPRKATVNRTNPFERSNAN